MHSIEALLKGIDIVKGSSINIPVNTVTADSRHVMPGSMFVALEGTSDNGLNYVQDAVNQGAAVILSNGGAKADDVLTGLKTPTVRVNNIRNALSGIAANLHGKPSEKLAVIGITGTNGKTTTGYLLDSIMKSANKNSGLIGTLGVLGPGLEAHTELTTPDSLELQRTLALFLDGGLTHAVIEVSSHALELERVAHVDFDLAIFTNFSQDHIDFHGNMDSYFAAKTKLFSNLSSNKYAILNANDPKSAEIKNLTKAKILKYGINVDADVQFKNWGMSIDGIVGTVDLMGEKLNISSKLIGLYNLQNILAAITAAKAIEIPSKNIQKGINSLNCIPGRVEQINSPNGATIIVDYAHTPDAFIKLFSSLSELLPHGGRLGVVFGCGGNRDKEKRPLMAIAAETFANQIFLTPDNPRNEKIDNINSEIIKGFKKRNFSIYNDRADGIRSAIEWTKSGDILAILGKGRENFQITGPKKKHHSDIETVNNFIKEMVTE
tara:strand:- start:1659 stop:3137 length:1479 start_codon:yes stop_codon:yes gene_type:complete